MATSDLERDLLASDNKTLASNLGQPQPTTHPSVSATQSTVNLTNTEQIFQQLAQFLDNILDQKMETFDESQDIHASQLKKLKTESKASSSFKFKGNKIQYEFNMWLR